jgi:REase_DpnII-MboI
MVSVKPGWALQEPLERLRRAVIDQNKPGSLEGLLARHILSSNSHFSLDWRVECDQTWMDHYNPASLPMVASLGYSMAHDFHAARLPALREGIERSMGRDPLRGGHLNLNRHSATLLGLVLGVETLGPSYTEELAWSRRLATSLPEDPHGVEGDVLYAYIRWTVLGEKAQIPTLPALSLYQFSFYDWMIRRNLNRNVIAPEELRQSRVRALELAATDLAFETAYQAALIWAAVEASLFHALDSAALAPSHVAAVLRNFEAAMRRWRWDSDDLSHPIRWTIRQEREVQDILWLILRSYFDDVIDEETLPKFGHASYRIDFGIPSLGVIVEVKYAFERGDFKKIEKEILQDLVPYLSPSDRYRSVIVFIYDASASVQEHDMTRQSLLTAPGVVDVIIVSRPSQVTSMREQAAEKMPRPNANG